jgi:4-aminobutyrate aminotransferase/(S)-3-amino-2-methylpropionate transaminase
MGLPLSGVLGRAAIMDAGHVGAVGGTYVGNPVAQAAALAVLDVIEDEGLVERSAQLGETIHARMLGWQDRWDAIGDVRGLGSMLAIELVSDAASRTPAPELTHAIVDAALQRGLVLITCGVYGNCIRVLVPLVVTDAELDEALGAWEEALAASLG